MDKRTDVKESSCYMVVGSSMKGTERKCPTRDFRMAGSFLQMFLKGKGQPFVHLGNLNGTDNLIIFHKISTEAPVAFYLKTFETS